MLIQADARLLPLAEHTVQCVVTSPPYFGLRDYGTAQWVGGDPYCDHRKVTHGTAAIARSTLEGGQKTNGHQQEGFLSHCGKCGAERIDCQIGLERSPAEYVATLVQVFREIRRVLKGDGTVWVNLGDSYSSGGRETQVRDTFRDAASGKHANLNGIAVRPGNFEGAKPKDLLGIPWRVAFALQSDGWYLRSDIIWHKPNPMPESVTDRPTKAHEYLFLLTKSERYYYDADAIAEPALWPDGPNAPEAIKSPYGQGFTRAARKNEQSGDRRKVGFNDRWEEKERLYAIERHDRGELGSPSQMSSIVAADGDRYMSGRVRAKHQLAQGDTPTRNKRTVWTIATTPYAGAHFATMPEKLVEPCILAGCPVGGLVLDPFVGSGTVGAVAERLGRRWVGTDLTYHELATERTAQRGLRW